MPVRMEVYSPQGITPLSTSTVHDEGSSLLIPLFGNVEAMKAVEVFGIFPDRIAGGVKLFVYTLDTDRIAPFTIQNPLFQQELFERLSTEPQKVTTKMIEYDLPSGEAWQYFSENKAHQVVFWHETGKEYDLAEFS